MSRHPAPDRHLTAEYFAYMASREWAEFRVRFFRFTPKACAGCGYTRSVDLHHRTYERFGHEWLTDVVPLCRKCHDKVHDLHKSKPSLTLWSATNRIIGRRDQRRKPKRWFAPGKVRLRTGRVDREIHEGEIAAAKTRLRKAEENRLLMLTQIRFHVAKKSLKT